jgi:type IX secretion system PorP/SprF family membrane protein
MRVLAVIIFAFICSLQTITSQEDDGVVSLNLPVRNSLTFNRYALNPTFSFVREQSKYISVYNKREWVQFDDAPLTYLLSYSGRFGENIGAGLGLFQQNYGVLTTFGGILNFAYNAQIGRDTNLTFGLNVGAYKSGLNTSNVVTNFEDPSLQNVPENFLLTINPGINFGTEFFDFGVSVNNLALYNFESSEMIQDNPEQGIQAHVMYTGYMDSRGFFDESKFSGLIRSEFRKDETIIAALAMVTVPKGIWAQVGYNSVFGASGGLGINLTTQIAIEYNFETAMGDLSNFGPSHEITLAYRFKNRNNYNYSNEDEIVGLLSGSNKKRRVVKSKKPKTTSKKPIETDAAKAQAEALRLAAIQKEQAEREAKLLAEKQAKEKAEAEAMAIADQKAKEAAKAKRLEEQRIKLQEEQRAKEIAETRARLLAEQKAIEEAEAKAKQIAAQKAAEEAQLLAEQEAKKQAEVQRQAELKAAAEAKLVAEQKAKEEATAKAKQLELEKAKQEADRLAKIKADEDAKRLSEEKARQDAEAKAKQLEEQKAALEAAKKAQEQLITNPKDEIGKSMLATAKQAEASKKAQNDLLNRFDEIVSIKEKDLKDLKEENDLSDQGITVQPRPFKSVTEENNRLRAIQSELESTIETRTQKLDELKLLFKESEKSNNDTVNSHYREAIDKLEAEQLKAKQIKVQLESKLESIRVATEFEKRRRIKRAAFDNEEDRYAQDRAMLQNIKRTTETSDNPPKEEDFNFGEELGDNIKILKNINNVENGYYLIIAVHNDINKRNEFVKKVVESGRKDVDFFYDVNTSKYYIYYNKFDFIEQANEAIKTKGNRPYNGKMSIVKIEN